MTLTTEEQLRELYGQPSERAQKKVLDFLDDHCRNFLAKSPFGLLSSVGESGRVDVSPKGGSPGFVQVDGNRLLIPDAKGNQRLDGLVNIVQTGRAGSLWMIPGVNETLRINGAASISTDADHLSRFRAERNLPKTVVVLEVEEVFFHCAKALMRSGLWEGKYAIERSAFPSMGQILKDQIGGNGPVESQEEMERRYSPDL